MTMPGRPDPTPGLPRTATPGPTDAVLLGRAEECHRLEQLIADVHRGQSGSLLIRGEAGVGKSALLEHLVARASGCRVLRAAGVQAEMEIAFAGLHHLCTPLLDRLDSIPVPQRDALAGAFGLQVGSAPDRFLLGLAVLSLLAGAAGERPIVCIVDDAQWLDGTSQQALGFVARRLVAESVVMVFAMRDSADDQALAGIPQLVVGGLKPEQAGELLAAAMPGPLDEKVRDRIVAETRGNPLALLELPRGLTHSELAGGFGLLDAQGLSDRIEESFQQRLAELPPAAQRLLQVASAEATGDAGLVERAASRLGIPVATSSSTSFGGLLEWTQHLTFRHPLARSAVYRAASPQQRREAHRALAEVTDPVAGADRRAWHLGHSTEGPDEDVAAELERSAERARDRGGLAAVAAFLDRAAHLTPSPVRRVPRTLSAAEATLQIGAFDATLRLLGEAAELPLNELQRARIDLLLAELAFASNRGNRAAPLLVAAARRLVPLEAGLALDTFLDAIAAAMFAGRLADGTGVEEVAAIVRATPCSRPPERGDLILDALVTRFTNGYAAAVPSSERALGAFRGGVDPQEGLRRYWLVASMAADLWQDEHWQMTARRYVRLARDVGAMNDLALALNSRAVVEVFTGDLQTAALLVDEARTVTEATGGAHTPYGALWLAAWQGREADARELSEATLAEASARGEGIGLSVTHAASAVLSNAAGQYERAALEAQQASQFPHELAAPNWALAELVEAAAHLDDGALAADAFARLSAMTSASATEWALGVEARSRAQLHQGDAAEAQYREAIERLSHTAVRAELARARLLYGEWLRRRRRRHEAREQLRTALEAFTTMGAAAFAARTRRELLATGETVRTNTAEAATGLTAQQTLITRLARRGLSNSEIGAQLFLSPRTVEWHLGKIFAKLGVSSRHELDRIVV
jgi:DNA-binding CsgD family transcriptional regulator